MHKLVHKSINKGKSIFRSIKSIIMTVQELIDELNKIEDKSLLVKTKSLGYIDIPERVSICIDAKKGLYLLIR